MNNQTLQIVTLIAVIITLVLWVTWNFNWASDSVTKQDIELIVKNAIEKQLPAPSAQPNPTPQPSEKIAPSEFKTFYDSSYIKWNKDAKVTIIEFSDFECPFCKRHDNQWTLEQVLSKYWDDVNVIFAHFPLDFHQLAQKAQEAAECIWEQWWSDAYYAFKKWLFAKEKPTREAISEVAWMIDGIDVNALGACIDQGKFAQKVADSMAFWRKLWVTGTPWNVVVNNETGEFTKVSGAVPSNAFDSSISSFLQ